jgi:peptide deformylase
MTEPTFSPYPIVLYPAPVLKKRARALTPEEIRTGQAGGLDLRELVARMLVTMREAEGLGLAATQVGLSLRLFIAHPDAEHRPPVVCFNPVLSEMRGAALLEEGCLSFPGVRAKIKRAERLVLEGLDEKANPFRISAEGLEARCYQHETDHLDGILLVQRMGTAARFMLRDRLRELEDEYAFRQRQRPKVPAKT